MSIIRKNPNEVLYPTGKKTYLTIIKNEASPQIILWRVPYEDFNEGSKVIVAENEEALFYKNGIIEGSFTGGEYTLNTDNYPFLSRIRNHLSGGISAYNCRIIYVNKIHHLDNKWGTDGPIQVVDKIYNIPVNMIARGAYSIQISDAKKFYMKFAGATASALNAQDIASDMRGPINQKIKSSVSQVIEKLEVEILGIGSRLEEIAESLRNALESVFDEYGVRLVNFYIEALEIVEDETYSILKSARVEAAARVVDAYGRRNELNILENDYGRVKTTDIMMAAANNPSNGTMSEGLGLGAGVAMGGIMSASASGVLSPLNAPRSEPICTIDKNKECNNRYEIKSDDNSELITAPCGHKVRSNSKFCPECGSPIKIICPDCGKELNTSDKFCSNCGKGMQ
ncbi:SPFH domain-containing protein [Candidatus Methanomassiliicoccus intestinalis]|uniref:SPFH domain-containing protein n=1 Tax=Candidatus Methanomassiliicoccus intestinalis TaxID=1406512 RepID=UPI0037DD1BE3